MKYVKYVLVLLLVASTARADILSDLSQQKPVYMTDCVNDKGEQFLCVVKEMKGKNTLSSTTRKVSTKSSLIARRCGQENLFS